MANPLEIGGPQNDDYKNRKKNPLSSIHSHIGDKFHFEVPFHSSIICKNSLGTRFKNKNHSTTSHQPLDMWQYQWCSSALLQSLGPKSFF
jgi:hypothetical protein